MKYVIVFASLTLPFSVHAASFNCDKARTYVEKTICSTPKLSELDEALASTYKTKLANAKEKNDTWTIKNTKAEQARWLTYQRNGCSSETCIGREYNERLKAVLLNDSSTKGAEIYNKYRFFPQENEKKPQYFAYGHYEYKHKVSVYDPTQPNDVLIGDSTDTLTIQQIPRKPHLAIIDGEFTGGNANLCSIVDEKFTWRENHWSLFKTESYSKDSGLSDIHCEMRIYPTKQGVYVRDIDNECRRISCGVRAGYDNTLLKRVLKK